MESVLYGFTGTPDGQSPQAALTNMNGTSYGTTAAGGTGGTNGNGTVFTSTPSGGESVLYRFTGAAYGDGAAPEAALTNVGGTLYGTTQIGGPQNIGTVFKITTSGTETVLHSFTNTPDGAYPVGSLINVGGTLYGETAQGGANNYGAVYKIKCRTTCTESVLYNFAGGSDGEYPYAGLTNVNGTLYGTTAGSGSNYSYGTVFKLTTSGTETVLHSFAGAPDGQTPQANLIRVGSSLYGTTYEGGADNLGTVFKVTTSGTESVLYSFVGGTDGAYPLTAGLINVNGAIFGTTSEGGDTACGNGTGCGTVFLVFKSGAEIVLYSFTGGTDGAYPEAAPINMNGTLYGTTAGGGSSNFGTLFSLSI